MTIEIKLPELGENIASGDVVKILVQEGQQIDAGRGLMELETEKAVVEIPCPHAGKIVKVLVAKGQNVKVGQAIAIIESVGSQAATAPSAPPAKQPTEPPAKQAGLRSPDEQPQTPLPVPCQAAPAAGGPIPAGPGSRRLARELGVDLERVQGTGPHGRIMPEDVQGAVAAATAVTAEPSVPLPATPAVPPERVVPTGEPSQDAWGPIVRERMSQIRRAIATQMSRSASVIPHVTNFDDADITELDAIRKGIPAGTFGPGVKLTMTTLVMKAVATAIKRHPLLNASLDDEAGQIVYKQYVHLGLAVDTPRGLVVPAVRNVDRMSIAEVARSVASVAERARSGKFALEELRGGTFTISNLGAVGGTYSTPIINHPEVAILLLGRSRWMPVVVEGHVEPRFLLPLSLSFDHRVVDGAAAARFLNDVIALLQAPGRLLVAS